MLESHKVPIKSVKNKSECLEDKGFDHVVGNVTDQLNSWAKEEKLNEVQITMVARYGDAVMISEHYHHTVDNTPRNVKSETTYVSDSPIVAKDFFNKLREVIEPIHHDIDERDSELTIGPMGSKIHFEFDFSDEDNL